MKNYWKLLVIIENHQSVVKITYWNIEGLLKIQEFQTFDLFGTSFVFSFNLDGW